MRYNPKAVTEHDRSYAYNALWGGLPASLLLVIGLQFPSVQVLTLIGGGFVSGTFIGLIFIGHQDEFVRVQLSYAANWALCFAGLVLFTQVVPISRDYGPDTGLVLAILAAIFHAALAYPHLRDR